MTCPHCAAFNPALEIWAKRLPKEAVLRRVPVSFGVLTTDSIEQAIERAGTKAGNKGVDAAMAVLEMANLLERL